MSGNQFMCMYSATSDMVVTTTLFTGLVKTDKAYVIADNSEGISAYVCNVEPTVEFYKAIAFNAVGSSDINAYNDVLKELKKGFNHRLNIILDRYTETVSLASFTHADEVIGGFLSGYTTKIADMDYKLAGRSQYLTQSFITMPMKNFNIYTKQDLIFTSLTNYTELLSWVENPAVKERLEDVSEFNALTNRILEQTLTTFDKKPKIIMTRFDGNTGEYQFNNFNKINIYNNSKVFSKTLKKLL